MQQQQGKPLMTIHEQRKKALKQKEDTLQTVLTTAKTNPKFIKLLIYSLNSLEGFVSPPNREIRVNANIIIRLEGVEILRMITIANVKNEQIVTQAGSILWKLMSIFDIVDQDLAKLFADKNGHKAVIEILVTKDKAVGNSVPYIRILNGLVQIPQLIAMLLESGLAETVKKINELYPDDLDILSLNFDTMKKISNQKAGRELLVEKGLVKSILDNILQCAKAKNTKGVLSGLTIIDNLSRNENGKEAIISANGIECISSILDMYEHDDRILKKCAKIYSKIAKTDDMKNQLELLKKYYELLKSNKCESFKEITKALVLISNFMLVDEIGQTLIEPCNLQLLCDVFNFISKINLEGKTNEYIEAYVLLNKYFMVIFKRLFNSKPEITEIHRELLPNIENSFVKNWESINKIVEGSNADEGFLKSFMNVFRQYFCSYNDILYQCHRKASDEVTKEDQNYISMILYIIQNVVSNGKKYFDVHVESNFVASRVLKCAIDIAKQRTDNAKALELTTSVESVYAYLLNLFNISERNDTLSNTMDVIYFLISQTEFQRQKIETLIPVIVQFMNTKQKYRYSNLICLRILDIFLTPEFIEIYQKKPNPNQFPTHGLSYTHCIVSVMTKRFYQTSTVLKVFSSSKPDTTQEPVDFYFNEGIETDIALLGTELLKRLIDLMEFKKILKFFKETSVNFNPQDTNTDTILSLEVSILTLYSIIGIKEYYDLGVNEILDALKTLIQKEISFIEQFKREKANEKNPNYKEVISGVSKRLKIELELAKMIYTLSVQKENFPVILATHEIFQNTLLKSTDIKNLNNVVDYIKSHALFISRKERELKSKTRGNETFIDKLCEIFINLLRRLIEEEEVVESVIRTLNEYVELKKETCNYLVKGGCPRLLLQVMETTSKVSLAHQALKLLKVITMSNEQNLTMIASQNTLLKLFELRAKFVNEEKITSDCDLISNEILKLPGQEKYASEVLLEAISEFNANASGDYQSNDIKSKLLNSLEIINAFSSNKRQVEFLMINNQFYKNLNEISVKTINDNQVSQISEKLMTNEIAVYKKLKENVDDFDQNMIVSKLIEIIMKKSNFSDIFISSAKIFSGYLKDENAYKQYLDDKITNEFIDHLFEINDNYLDDPKVSKEINNILCYLCLRNSKHADYIKTKGGLANVLEELRMNLSSNDPASQLLKLNALKMLETLCRDEKSMELFVKANGVSLIHNIIKNELTLYPKNKEREVYMTNESISTIDKIGHTKPETYFSYCVKIIKNGIEKGYKDFIDEKQMKNLVLILHAQYPNVSLYQEIASICLHDSLPLKLKEKYMILLTKCALSIEAKYAPNPDVYFTTYKLMIKLSDKIPNNKEYAQGLKKEIKQCLATFNLDQLNRITTYLSLVISIMPNYINTFTIAKDEIIDLFKKLVNVYGNKDSSIHESLSDGIVISLMLLINYIAKNARSELDLQETSSKLINMGLHYYNPSNSVFALEFLKEFEKLYTSLGKEIVKEPSIKYMPEYLLFLHHVFYKSFEYLDKIHFTIKESQNYNSIASIDREIFDKTLDSIKSYINTSDENEEKSRSMNRLYTIILNLIDDFIDISSTMNQEEFKKNLDKLWEILNLGLHQDYSKSIIENSDMLKVLFKLMTKSKKKSYSNNDFNEILNEISKNVENSTDLFDNIVKQIEEELTVTPKQNVTSNLETLANISKYSSAGKIILKSSPLWKELNGLYSTCPDLIHRRLIATIYSNVMKNSYNLDLLLSTEPDTFKYIGQKISQKENIIKDEKDWDIADTEVDTISNILADQNNYQQITQKKLITNDDLQTGIENYKGVNKSISTKLEQLIKKIEAHHQHEKEETSYKTDIELLGKLTLEIETAFDEHMNILSAFEEKNEEKKGQEKTSKQLGIKRQQSKVVQSGTVLQTSSNANRSRLSLISRTLFYNEKNGTIASPLSTRNSQEMSAYLDSVLALIRLMYNSNKINQDKDMKVKREDLIVKGLRLIKLLSICEDNHKGILELGLINFMERLVLDNITNNSIYIASLDILKNCTWSENAVLVLLESPLLDKLIEEVLDLYSHPEKLANSEELCSIFLYENMNFSNLCKSKKGFEEVFKKIGLEKLRQIGTVTGNVVVLTSIVDMILNYLQNNEGIELSPEFIADVIKICEKGLSIADKTPGLISKTVRLIGIIYVAKGAENIRSLNVIQVLQREFGNYKCEPDFLLDIIYTLAKICLNNEEVATDCVDSGLLNSIVEEVMKNSDQNDNLIEKLSLLFRNLVTNNKTNCEKLCQDEIINYIMTLIEKYSIRCKQSHASSKSLVTLGDKLQSDKDKQQGSHLIENRILINLIYTLNSLTCIQMSVDFLAKGTSFLKTLINTIDRAISDVEIVKISLHSIGNYFSNDKRKDWKHFEIEQLYTILKNLQKQYYANSEILTNINHISGYILRGFDSMLYTTKYYGLIMESLNCQDWNLPLVSLSFTLIREALIKHQDLIVESFDETKQQTFNILKLYFNNAEVQIKAYDVLSIYAKSSIYSFLIVNSGIMPIILDSIDNDDFNSNDTVKLELRTSLMNLLCLLGLDEGNAKLIANTLLERLVREIEEEYADDLVCIVFVLATLLRHKKLIEPFIQYNGLPAIIKHLTTNPTKGPLVLGCFKVIGDIAYAGDEFRKLLQDNKLNDIIADVLSKGKDNKKVVFEANALTHLVNLVHGQKSGKEYKEIDMDEIRIEKLMKNQVKAFLTSGRTVKIYTVKGKVKEKSLVFSQDLLKVMCKKAKTNIPPKPKWVIETLHIQKIVKGHGTELFKKSKTLFRNLPKPEKCFSIIGPLTIDGVKSFNAECETEDEVNLWVKYLELAFSYLTKHKD